MEKWHYLPHLPGSRSSYVSLPLHQQAEAQAIGVENACKKLKASGFEPDLVISHGGFGASLRLKNAFPRATHLRYLEWFFDTEENAFTEKPERPPSKEYLEQAEMRNSVARQVLESGITTYTPTQFQFNSFPDPLRKNLHIIHDGVNTGRFKPVLDLPATQLYTLPGTQTVIPADARIISYVSRGLEPLRGFIPFMRSLAVIQQENPDVHTVIAGSEKASYSAAPQRFSSYMGKMLSELNGMLDLSRIHFTGLLNTADYLDLLQHSAVHVYLTRPFVLSWSVMEALSTGCVVIGSDTEPVREVIQDGENGFLVPFNNPYTLADKTLEVLDDQENMISIRRAARQTILDRYSSAVCLQKQVQLIKTAFQRKLT